MPLDANAELELIDAEVRHLPKVLAIRVEIYRTLEKWALMQTVAKKLAQYDPTSPKWALMLTYALRRAESIEAAKRVLLDAMERFPDSAALRYNLACYECQLRQLDSARERLKKAFELDPTLRLHALDDAELESIWRIL